MFSSLKDNISMITIKSIPVHASQSSRKDFQSDKRDVRHIE